MILFFTAFGLVLLLGIMVSLLVGPILVPGTELRVLVVILGGGALFDFLWVLFTPTISAYHDDPDYKVSTRIFFLIGTLAWVLLAWAVHVGFGLLGLVGFVVLHVVALLAKWGEQYTNFVKSLYRDRNTY